MANKKITDLPELIAVASDDYLEIVDTSANTSKKISRENLIGSSGGWQSWTPTLVGWESITTLICYYIKIGKILFFSAIIDGTSNSTTTSFTLPETARLTEYTGTMGLCVNNGSPLTVASRYGIDNGSNICEAYTNMYVGAWTASGRKRISVFGWIATN